MIMTDELPEKCCGKCEKWKRHGKGLISGKCVAPVPAYVRMTMFSSFSIETDGDDCPCFEPKEKPDVSRRHVAYLLL